VGVVSLSESGIEVALEVAFLVFFSFGTVSGSVFDMTCGRLPSRESVIMRVGGGEDSFVRVCWEDDTKV